MKDKKLLFIIAQISLALYVLVNYFFMEGPAVDFAKGFCCGLSIVFNIVFLIMQNRENKMAIYEHCGK